MNYDKIEIGPGICVYYNTDDEYVLVTDTDQIVLDSDTFDALISYRKIVENGPNDE